MHKMGRFFLALALKLVDWMLFSLARLGVAKPPMIHEYRLNDKGKVTCTELAYLPTSKPQYHEHVYQPRNREGHDSNHPHTLEGVAIKQQSFDCSEDVRTLANDQREKLGVGAIYQSDKAEIEEIVRQFASYDDEQVRVRLLR